MRIASKTRLSLAAVGSLAAVAAFSPVAQADPWDANHDLACERSATTLNGLGASFQRDAQRGWGAEILTAPASVPLPAFPGSYPVLLPALAQGWGYDVPACKSYKLPADGGTKKVRYLPSGSGSARTAMGANSPGAPRDPSVDFAETDEPPTATQIANANEGDPNTTADNAVLHTIPVAQGSTVIAVRLPDGCQVASSSARQLSRVKAEQAWFNGSTAFDQWYELFGSSNVKASPGSGLTDQQCQAKKFKRVVRLDSSGTTFGLKKYFQAASGLGGSGTDWREPAGGGTLANTAWPNDTGAKAVIRGAANGNGPLLDALSAQSVDGGIGYADLGTARSKGYGWDYSAGVPVADDRTFWVRIQQIETSAFVSPAKFDRQDVDSSQKGVRCSNVTYTSIPADTTGSWFDTDAVLTPVDYPLCVLTYAMRWESPKVAVNMPIDRARGSMDRIGYMVDAAYLGSFGKGQNKLGPSDYGRLPSAILSIARAPFADPTGTDPVDPGQLQW